jgi:hypothetical protein
MRVQALALTSVLVGALFRCCPSAADTWGALITAVQPEISLLASTLRSQAVRVAAVATAAADGLIGHRVFHRGISPGFPRLLQPPTPQQEVHNLLFADGTTQPHALP